MLGPIRVGETSHLCQQVDVVCTAGPHFCNGKMFKDIQHLDNMDAAGTGRRHRGDFITSIRSAHRLPNDHLVRGQRCCIDKAAATRHFGHDQISRLATVEPLGTLLRNAIQGGRKIFLHENLARFVRHTSILVEVATRHLISAHALLSLPEQLGEVITHGDALARLLDGWLQDTLPRQAAEFAMCFV